MEINPVITLLDISLSSTQTGHVGVSLSFHENWIESIINIS